MHNISGSLIVLGVISFLFPFIITAIYLLVKNKRIAQKLLFLMTGTFCCFGVKFFASFLHGQIVRYFINPQKPPTSFTPMTIFLTTFDLLIQIALSLVVLSYLEKKLYLKKVEKRENGDLILRDSVVFSLGVFSLGVLFGCGICVASSMIFGTKEAFDSPFYGLTLVGGGALCSLFSKDRAWRWVVAILIGQLIGFALLVVKHPGPLWPLGVLFIFIYSSAVFLGTILGSYLNSIFSRIKTG